MLRKVIDLYLRGFGYQEISKRTDIARSTVQDAVNNWKSGNTGIFGEAIGYVDDITEIARYMRQNGIRIEDLKMPFLNAYVLRGLNIDLQELYPFYDTIRGYGPDVVSSMARTVIDLQSLGIDTADMVQKLDSLGTEIKEMENRKEQLIKDVSSVDGVLKEKIRAKESLEKEISDLRTITSPLKQQEKDISNEINRDSDRIAKSDRFWSAAGAMGIDPIRVAEFMENARSMGYDAKTIPGIKEIERYGMDRSMSPDDMCILVMSLRQLNSAGWSPDSIVKLSMAMGGVADTPDAVIDHMREYTHKYRDVTKVIDELDRQLSDARNEHDQQMGILNSKAEELAGQLAAAIEEKNAVENEITELVRKKEKEEALYRKAVGKLKEYTGSVVHITELQDAIERQNGIKKDLENSTDSLKRKLAGMRISADVAEALPSIIKGKDMKIMQLCAAFTATPNSTAANEMEIRDRIISDIIDMSEGGIVPVQYSSRDRFISGSLYDRLMKLDRERIRVSEEKAEPERLRNLYGTDIRSYLDDCLSGRIPSDSSGYRMIREIAEKSFRDEVRQRLDQKAIADVAKDSGAANRRYFWRHLLVQRATSWWIL